MGVLADWQIRKRDIITPFEPAMKRPGVISYGVSSYGYDIRAGYKWKVFTNVWGCIVDPKAFDPKAFVDVDVAPQHVWAENPEYGNDAYHHYCARCGVHRYCVDQLGYDKLCKDPAYIVIPPNSFALTETLEEFSIPRDTLAIVIGKSTYARCGIIVNVTPLEPEWKGRLTVEISNTTPLPAKVYAGEGIGQVYFLTADGVCEQSYADKQGKYQNQGGVTPPKVD